MKQKVLILITGLLVGGLIIVSTNAQEEMTVVDNSIFENPERPSALFQHDTHNENAEIEECNECHHVYEDGVLQEDESSEDLTCSECHEFKSSTKQPALMKAYHQNCKGCHIQKKIGPIMCGECHRKEGTT
jgi:hypothetical protein